MNSDTARLVSVLRQLPAPRRVLDLGCGDCRDVVAYYESGWLADTHVVGIDLDFRGLAKIGGRTIHLAQADFRQLPLSASFDLILIRHPDIARNKVAWQYAVKQLSEWLSGNGAVLISTYSVPEMDMIRDWLRGTAFRSFALDMTNIVPPGLAGRDRFLMVYVTTSAAMPRSPAGK